MRQWLWNILHLRGVVNREYPLSGKRKNLNYRVSFGQAALTFACTGPLPALGSFIDDFVRGCRAVL